MCIAVCAQNENVYDVQESRICIYKKKKKRICSESRYYVSSFAWNFIPLHNVHNISYAYLNVLTEI